jgi:cysteine synthase A
VLHVNATLWQVIVFSLEYCEFCWSATKMLKSCGVPFEVVNVDALKYAKGNFGGQV